MSKPSFLSVWRKFLAIRRLDPNHCRHFIAGVAALDPDLAEKLARQSYAHEWRRQDLADLRARRDLAQGTYAPTPLGELELADSSDERALTLAESLGY